jgi:hypothetical protein
MQRQRELLRQRAVLDSLYGETRSDIARLIAGDDVAGTNAMKTGAVPQRPDEMRTYRPSLSENVKYTLSDALQSVGVKSHDANQFSGGVTDLIGLTPVGVAFAANDMQRAAERHDYPGAAIAALGVIPAVRPAAKVVRARTAFATHEAIPGANVGNARRRNAGSLHTTWWHDRGEPGLDRKAAGLVRSRPDQDGTRWRSGGVQRWRSDPRLHRCAECLRMARCVAG